MPSAARAFCLEPGCAITVHGGGRCSQHKHKQGAVGHKWYHTARWQRLREIVLIEQPFCADCLEPKAMTKEIHHKVKPYSDPVLFWDRENLLGLCRIHHRIRTLRGE